MVAAAPQASGAGRRLTRCGPIWQHMRWQPDHNSDIGVSTTGRKTRRPGLAARRQRVQVSVFRRRPRQASPSCSDSPQRPAPGSGSQRASLRAQVCPFLYRPVARGGRPAFRQPAGRSIVVKGGFLREVQVAWAGFHLLQARVEHSLPPSTPIGSTGTRLRLTRRRWRRFFRPLDQRAAHAEDTFVAKHQRRRATKA